MLAYNEFSMDFAIHNYYEPVLMLPKSRVGTICAKFGGIINVK
jgi:hypothetical protein